jgi:23S rRNA (guanosine2251-2'-O)-methyltransferase
MADIIEGRNPVLEALRSGRPLTRILVTDASRLQDPIAEIISRARTAGVSLELVSKEALIRMSPTGNHQGVIAFGASQKYLAVDDLFSLSVQKKEPPLYCILDGIEDPQNFGSIIRTADASGIHGIVIRSRRAVGLTAAVARASAGAIEYVPVAMVPNISQAIEKLKKNNVWTVGIDVEGKVDYTSIDFKVPSAIVIGGEGKGISDLVKKRCDYLASIPMRGKISSLNASVAAALVMYEAFRQRKQ